MKKGSAVLSKIPGIFWGHSACQRVVQLYRKEFYKPAEH